MYTSCAGLPPEVQFDQGGFSPAPEGYHKILFLAYGRGTFVDNENSIAGHASIAIEGVGAWGFYPSKGQRLYTRRGVLRYTAGYPITQEYAEFFVDEGILNKLRELIAEWENNPPYFLIPSKDCVTFINLACDIIGLKYNPHTMLPIKAVRNIGSLNDQRRLYSSPP
jgi:hypothetical protein